MDLLLSVLNYFLRPPLLRLMRAAVLDDDGLRVREWAEPEPGPREALVAPSKVGICGSDVHLVVDGTMQPAFRPIVLGHEPAGRVVALGPDTEGPPPGTRVAVVPLISCGDCDRCRAGRGVLCRSSLCIGAERDGCWAERAVVPARNLIELPDGLPDEWAAIATDCVATAYHGVATRGGVGPGMRVAVWGAGGLGLSAVGIARHLGAATIVAIDPRPEARALALETGADRAVHPDDAAEALGALGGVDVAVELVGRPETVEGAVRSLDSGGRAVVVGLGHDRATIGRLTTFVPPEREVVGSYGSEAEEIATVIGLLADGDLDLPGLLGETIPLGDVLEGIERLARGETGGSRLVVDVTA